MIYVFEGGSIVYDESVLSEEDKSKAVGIEELPALEAPIGKTGIIKADKTTDTVWWEYVDTSQSVEFTVLEAEIQGLQQAMAELAILLAGGEA